MMQGLLTILTGVSSTECYCSAV